MSKTAQKVSLKVLAVIVDDEGADNVTKIFRAAQVHLHYHVRAHGTASSEILDLLGLGHSEKVVIMVLATQYTIYGLQKKVARELRLMAPGRGIAFVLPLSGISALAYRLLEHDMHQTEKRMESEVNVMNAQINHDLILAVINRGYSEELMDAAREAGAGGGTVVPAHRINIENPMRFWGVSLQEEKDLVAIVSKRESKAAIMRAISHKCGLNSEAQGVVLSLPVESVIGLETLE